MKIIPRSQILLLLAAGIVGCETVPTGPALDADPVALALASAEESARGERVGEYQPVLDKLFRQAIARIAGRNGSSPEADEILAEVERLTQAAAAAAAAGNLIEAERLTQQAEIVKARAVIRVFGAGVVNRVIGAATARLEALQNRVRLYEARGHHAPQELLDLIARTKHLLSAAQEAQSAGNHPSALVLAATAFDQIVLHRTVSR